MVSFDASQGPMGLFVVSTNATVPLEMSAALGEYVVFNELTLAKDPVPRLDHVALVAAPPIEPFNRIFAPAHTEVSLPAFTKGVAFKLIVASSFTVGHGDMIPFAVNVSVIAPVTPLGGVYVAFSVFAFG
jgi:hypothetical protein